jgi:hypothetical protein
LLSPESLEETPPATQILTVVAAVREVTRAEEDELLVVVDAVHRVVGDVALHSEEGAGLGDHYRAPEVHVELAHARGAVGSGDLGGRKAKGELEGLDRERVDDGEEEEERDERACVGS